MMQLKGQFHLQLLQLGAALALVSAADLSSEAFSCDGLAAGFYADIASGCQLYHMCDGAGRQFTHSCPNQTLFQQRTMVCDHWYMVKCNSLDLEQSSKVLKNENTQGRELQGQQKSQKQHRHSQRVLEPFPYIQRNSTRRRNTTEARKREEFHIGANVRKEDNINSQLLNKQPSVSPLLQISSNNRESTSSFEDISQRQTERIVNSDNNYNIDQIRTSPIITSPRPNIFSIRSETQFSTSTLSYKNEKLHDDSGGTSSNVEPFQQTRNRDHILQNVNEEEKAIKQNAHEDTRKNINNKAVEDISLAYNHNPYIQSYIKTISNDNDNSYLSSVPSINYEDERETLDNNLEIILPDPRKMFYIPDSNYNQSDVSVDQGSSVLIIDLPNYYQSPTRTMKFHKSDDGNQGTNPKCPRCHPSFLLPGQCQPCVLIR